MWCQFWNAKGRLHRTLSEHKLNDISFISFQFYYAHRLEHQRVGPTITETDENVLLANLEVLVKERMVVSVGSNGEPEMFRCSACDVTSDAEHIVRTHIRRSHVYKLFPPPLKPTKEYICDYCGNMLKTKGALRQHFMIHSGTKSHACSFCGKEFRLRLDKVVHERTHTGEVYTAPHVLVVDFIEFLSLLTATLPM